jgi:hypothetical protein
MLFGPGVKVVTMTNDIRGNNSIFIATFLEKKADLG